MNGILWQVYRVRYAHRKVQEPTTVVSIAVAAGNYRLDLFSVGFVKKLGKGDLDAGALAVAQEVRNIDQASVLDGSFKDLPLFTANAAFTEKARAQRETYNRHRIYELRRQSGRD